MTNGVTPKESAGFDDQFQSPAWHFDEVAQTEWRLKEGKEQILAIGKAQRRACARNFEH
jgi:hypothetical protein